MQKRKKFMSFGLILVIVGILWLLESIGFINSNFWAYIWPVILILFGLDLLQRDETGDFMWCNGAFNYKADHKDKNKDKEREIVDEQ